MDGRRDDMRIASSLLSFYEWWYNCVQDSLICGVGGADSSPWERFRAMAKQGALARAGAEWCLIYHKPAMCRVAQFEILVLRVGYLGVDQWQARLFFSVPPSPSRG